QPPRGDVSTYKSAASCLQLSKSQQSECDGAQSSSPTLLVTMASVVCLDTSYLRPFVVMAQWGPIKAQVLADFALELSAPSGELASQVWILSVDGASNLKGSGARVVLEGQDGVLIEQSPRFEFKASNNQAEYEPLIAGMKLAIEMEVKELRAKSDSQLVM
ncbi:gag-pol polyprotein, partial [Trifolium medium]|nr:gag-pol polyprotein [Trifolium medium]